jgi:hypothetical protein
MDDGDYPITSLVDAAATGDEHAWHEIVDRYVPCFLSVIRPLPAHQRCRMELPASAAAHPATWIDRERGDGHDPAPLGRRSAHPG